MINRLKHQVTRRWPVILLLLALIGYWLAPISGQVIILTGQGRSEFAWPNIQVDPLQGSSTGSLAITVSDVEPWGNVLLTVDGKPAALTAIWRSPGVWHWRWTYVPRQAPGIRPNAVVAFYHDCDTGCIWRGQLFLSSPDTPPGLIRPGSPASFATKLGVVFASPDRDWHGRRGWDVELTYARAPNDPGWGIDALAEKVQKETSKGLRVLVRVDYDRGQSVPPTGDYLALTAYLQYLRRLARDERLSKVYGFIIGSGYNAREANLQAPGSPVTPDWYARVFSGYGAAVDHTDNVVQTIRAENDRVAVLVGPVRPWCFDSSGNHRFGVDAPWLDYFNTLVGNLDQESRIKAAAGIPLVAPDGFALQAPGNPEASELAGRDAGTEPRIDLRRTEWDGAQGGFRVYRDWLAVINSYPVTQGLPAYITSTNTYVPDRGIPPAQNYPPGWLTAALQVVDAEPQVKALCWFLDGPLNDEQWQWFSLGRRPGRLGDAADEFDRLLRMER